MTPQELRQAIKRFYPGKWVSVIITCCHDHEEVYAAYVYPDNRLSKVVAKGYGLSAKECLDNMKEVE